MRENESVSGGNGLDSGASGSGRGLRILQILLFAIIYQVCEVVWAAVSLFQVGALLLTGSANATVAQFAVALTDYMAELLQFICQRSEELPWPLSEPRDRR